MLNGSGPLSINLGGICAAHEQAQPIMAHNSKIFSSHVNMESQTLKKQAISRFIYNNPSKPLCWGLRVMTPSFLINPHIEGPCQSTVLRLAYPCPLVLRYLQKCDFIRTCALLHFDHTSIHIPKCPISHMALNFLTCFDVHSSFRLHMSSAVSRYPPAFWRSDRPR